MAALNTPSFVTYAATAPTESHDGITTKALASGAQTSHNFMLLEYTMSKSYQVDTKTNDQDQMFHVLEGQCTFNAGDQQGLIVMPGDFLAIPKYTQYSYSVDVAETRMLNFMTPSGPEKLDSGNKSTSEMPPQTSTLKPFITSVNASPAYWALNERWTLLASKLQTGGSYTMTNSLFPQGNVCPPIKYDRFDEIYYILDGSATFLLGEEIVKVGKGDFLYVPKGNVWAIRVDSESMNTIMVQVPGGLMEALIPIMGNPAEKEGLPPKGLAPPVLDPEVHKKVVGELGIHALDMENPLKQE